MNEGERILEVLWMFVKVAYDIGAIVLIGDTVFIGIRLVESNSDMRYMI